MSERVIEKDEEFEAFVREESPGIVDAARMRYYADGYDLFFTPVRTEPLDPRDAGNRCIMRPMHSQQDRFRGLDLVAQFENTHPGRGIQFRDKLRLCVEEKRHERKNRTRDERQQKKESIMCGSRVSEDRIAAAGLLNSLKGSEWLGVAEELAALSEEDYGKVIRAFGLYRTAVLVEQRGPLAHERLPPRG